MGAFVSDLLSKDAEKVGDLFDRGVTKAASSGVGKFALNMAGNQEWEMSLTEGGKAISKIHKDYIKLHDTTLDQQNKKVQAIRDFHSSDVGRAANIPHDAPIATFHKAAMTAGHPAQNVTRDIVGAGDGGLNQDEYMIKSQQIARLTAVAGTYGEHYENATPIIAGMLRDPNPDVVNNAHRLADIVSNQTRDTRLFTDRAGRSEQSSAAKVYMNKAMMKAAKITGEDLEPGKLLNTEKTYTGQEPWERNAHRILGTVLTPYVALNHIGQLFNIAASSPLSAIGASLLRMDYDTMSQTVEASGITASTLWSSMYRDILGENGKIAEWTHAPTVGKIMARTIHQPGLSWVRKTQINMAGSVGFHSAIYWAHNFAESGSKIAKARLEELGIEPAEVLKQGGKLNDEQLQKGVYHYVNNRMFFNKGVDNSLYQNKNVWTRAMFMYHSFVNSQSTYMKRELMLMARAGDIKGIAQFVGTLGVLFPAIAPLLGGAETLLRSGSPTQAGQAIQKNYQSLTNADTPGEWIGNYFELISHLGAAGVYFNYINAIKANRLASAAAGPMVGAAATDATDVYHAAFMPNKQGHRNIDPLMRDVLKQTLPVIGSPLAHHFFPTTTEQKERGGSTSTSRQRRGFSTRRRRF